jgi:catechol 2,3-dioxygenase-like lactoylglutathione lyase family enzyme
VGSTPTGPRRIVVLTPPSTSAAGRKDIAMIPVSLNHVALDVADRRRSAEFYAELLGTEVVAEDVEHRLTFLRLPGSDRYSDLALHEHADVAAAYPPEQIRMAHIGWEIDDPAHLVAAYDFLTARTRVVLAADFGVARSVMGMDPDGHVIEFELFTPGATAEPGFAPLDIDALRAVPVAVA